MKNSKPEYTLVQSIYFDNKSKYLTWGYSVPLNSANTLHNVNGIRLLVTRRNYYYSHKDNKIRFQTMSAEDSSAEYYADVYAEIYPGLFQRFNICTDSNCSQIFELCAKYAKQWREDPEAVDSWRGQIELMN